VSIQIEQPRALCKCDWLDGEGGGAGKDFGAKVSLTFHLPAIEVDSIGGFRRIRIKKQIDGCDRIKEGREQTQLFLSKVSIIIIIAMCRLPVVLISALLNRSPKPSLAPLPHTHANLPRPIKLLLQLPIIRISSTCPLIPNNLFPTAH
jgi:hypothetical protein